MPDANGHHESQRLRQKPSSLVDEKMGHFRHLIVPLCVLAVYAAAPCSAYANPHLPLEIEGGTYDQGTESCELDLGAAAGVAPFRILTIGNLAGEGGKGTIHFDLSDMVYAKNHAQVLFAPISKGAAGDASIAPEPASIMMMVLRIAGNWRCQEGFSAPRAKLILSRCCGLFPVTFG